MRYPPPPRHNKGPLVTTVQLLSDHLLSRGNPAVYLSLKSADFKICAGTGARPMSSKILIWAPPEGSKI